MSSSGPNNKFNGMSDTQIIERLSYIDGLQASVDKHDKKLENVTDCQNKLSTAYELLSNNVTNGFAQLGERLETFMKQNDATNRLLATEIDKVTTGITVLADIVPRIGHVESELIKQRAKIEDTRERFFSHKEHQTAAMNDLGLKIAEEVSNRRQDSLSFKTEHVTAAIHQHATSCGHDLEGIRKTVESFKFFKWTMLLIPSIIGFVVGILTIVFLMKSIGMI